MNEVFKYPVLSKEQFDEQRKLLPPGNYNFEVISVNDKPSSAGNPMLTLKLRVWDGAGKEHYLTDWLVATPEAAFKIKQFWECVGFPEKYEQGEVNLHEFPGLQGELKSGIKPDKQGVDQARVVTYLTGKPANKPQIADDFKEDKDIPF